MADDVLLCASELATNADAAQTFPAARRGVHRPRQHDGGPWNPAACDPERGHGLDILRALADDWGIDGDPTGHTVWAWYDWPSP